MSENEKLEMLRNMTGETDTAVCRTYLTLAAVKITRRLYPFGAPNDFCPADIPVKYAVNQVDIAAYLMNKRGAEGQIGHSENGISRTYGDADVPESMLRGIVPYVGVVL